MFRTTKQYLGLEEYFSILIQKQFDHACAVLLAYSIAQVEMKKKRLKNPEAALRALKKKKLLLKNCDLMATEGLNAIGYA